MIKGIVVKYLGRNFIINDLLSEGTEAKIPSFIRNISKNMESTPLSKKTNFKPNWEEKLIIKNNKLSLNELNKKKSSFINICQNTTDITKNPSRSQKSTLKDDISQLLRIFANEKKNLIEVKSKSNVLLSNRNNEKSINLGSSNCCLDYVTMKEIQSISENQF